MEKLSMCIFIVLSFLLVMKTACLYIRVSTDEQAIKGYSLPIQEEKLREYCIKYNIRIIETVEEDYSAKTFIRPAWTKFIADLNRHKDHRPDLILFTKWDRFSRNVADTYYMIRVLGNLAIEIQAIDQPLDLAVPENKILLAIYIATAEAENDRRSINVRQGINKARKEGRWTANPPLGYSFIQIGKETKHIIPKEPEASFVKMAFSLITSDRLRSIHSIYLQLISSGLKCSKSHFWRVIKNPVYFGMVSVPAFEGSPPYLVKGIHQGIIPRSLFYEVQHILNNKKEKVIIRTQPDEKLPLRGFFYCPICNDQLTGSGSKGKYIRYYYYHCQHCRHFRIRADKVNNQFLSELGKLTAGNVYQELYEDILRSTRKELFKEHITSQKAFNQTISRLIERIIKGKELLLNGEIEQDDFTIIKADCEKRINLMGTELQRSLVLERKNRKNRTKAVDQLSHLGELWLQSDITAKRKLLTLILHDHPLLLQDLHIIHFANIAVQYVYELNKNDLNTRHYTKPCHTLSNYEKLYDKEILNKIIKQERNKNNNITEQEAQEIIDFMTEVSKLGT